MLFIDGAWTPAASGREFASRDPASGEVLGTVADAGREDAVAAVAAAQRAFRAWSKQTAHQRSAVLHRAWQLMTERREELATLMTREQGKPLKMARNEVGYAADFLLWFAEEAKRVYGETIPSARADQRFIVMHQPVGVAAMITPWNYPISMLTRKIAPALAAGCTVVVKPAEQTPLCAIATVKLLEEAGVPAGVVNLVTSSDPGPIGDVMLGEPAVRKISFTGSTEVGKVIAARAAEQMKRVSLELGGHAPFLVFNDADPVHAAKGAAAIKLLNTGQACICPNRLFVQRSIVEPFAATLRDRLEKVVAGHGLTSGVGVGPLIDEQALAKMQRQVDDALAKGAEVLAGGKRLTGPEYDKGCFWEPTVLRGVTPDMLVYREETFGPIAPIVEFDDEDEVLEMANDTTYGLASYVYTRDLSRALRTAEALDFGIIGINDVNPTSAAVPFGGIKESGLGREGARQGIHEYLDEKVCGIAL
ncbi:NAD-dependent succinate-semialdehyde dehydrogenase [Pseudonocardia kunmingensis]|uniref:Succinate-semialdehyde dehydrogenase/glutarate-semialdehyde dehydrogenase n=1 Tax=Pseudonocardia kunmingensis TaxID=630975 RepID=A0A543DPG3_9PSEU|nr:NAD-dependent succinate-semialdehyde dehydrogenase [Pseudonocardia kunmingensis]TQM11232.1 succinate-semialdehyde dehydrogenase/glutarate-semialdehyde dehydrogenase [Pseudonocardia kunmingensis]